MCRADGSIYPRNRAEGDAGGEAEDEVEEDDKFVDLMQPVWIVQGTALRGWKSKEPDRTLGYNGRTRTIERGD